MNTDITSKSAHKLLQQLESDPQLQSIEDTTILNYEQYPVAFESSIVNLKEVIPLTSAVTILRWQDGKNGKTAHPRSAATDASAATENYT